jgi:putative transposase
VNRLGIKHLKVSRTRQDFAVKNARYIVMSNDLVTYEDLKVWIRVKNQKLAKSINDAGWRMFCDWLQYWRLVYSKIVVARLAILHKHKME